MTTITYRNGVMAADTRAYSGDRLPIGQKKKIHRLSDGSLFGASSYKPGHTEKLRRFVEEHGVESSIDGEIEAQAIVVKPDGSIYYFNDQDTFSGPLEAEYIAVGSGAQFATGAFALGVDAIQALEVGIALDPWSALPITVLHLIE